MKRIISIIFLLLLFCLATSCVSTGKYRHLKAELYYQQELVDRLKTDSSYLAESNLELAENLSNEAAENTSKSYALDRKERKLERLQEKLSKQKEQLNLIQKKITDALIDFDSQALDVYLDEGQLHVSLSDKLLFPSGSAWIDEEGKQAIANISQVLQDYSEGEILVEGHTDNVPVGDRTYLDNWDLSVSRATAVARILSENGLAPEKILAAGRSFYDPLADNNTPEGREKNRRTEIILTNELKDLMTLIEPK